LANSAVLAKVEKTQNTESADQNRVLAQKKCADISLTIQSLREEHLTDVAVLDKSLFGSSWSIDSFRNDLLNTVSVNFVIYAGEKLIGYAVTWMIVDELHINKIAVKTDYQNRGIASWVLDFILQRAKQLEMSSAFIEVRQSNAGAIHLYKKCGFEEQGVRPNYYESPKEDALLMVRQI
jgi:ribosomal-protein-alanine N-acetyltransferase